MWNQSQCDVVGGRVIHPYLIVEKIDITVFFYVYILFFCCCCLKLNWYTPTCCVVGQMKRYIMFSSLNQTKRMHLLSILSTPQDWLLATNHYSPPFKQPRIVEILLVQFTTSSHWTLQPQHPARQRKGRRCLVARAVCSCTTCPSQAEQFKKYQGCLVQDGKTNELSKVVGENEDFHWSPSISCPFLNEQQILFEALFDWKIAFGIQEMKQKPKLHRSSLWNISRYQSLCRECFLEENSRICDTDDFA